MPVLKIISVVVILSLAAPLRAGELYDAVVQNNLDRVKEILAAHPESINEGIPKYNDTPLETASWHGFTDIVAYLLSRGADVNWQDNRQHTAVFCAAERNHVEAMRLLIGAHANLNVKDSKGNTPLVAADSLEMVKLLVEGGADVHVSPELSWNFKKIEYLERKGMDIRKMIGKSDSDMQSGLLAASHWEGNEELIKFLLDRGAEPNGADQEGFPLMFACRSGRLSLVQLLISHGADVNKRTLRDSGTAMMNAINDRRSAVDIVQALVDRGADVNALDHYGKSALFAASEYGDTATMAVLINAGAHINSVERRERAPLEGASRRSRAWIDYVPPDSVLHIEDLRRASAVRMLVAHGADVSKQRLILEWAIMDDNPEVVRALVESKVDVNWSALRNNSPGLIYRHVKPTPVGEQQAPRKNGSGQLPNADSSTPTPYRSDKEESPLMWAARRSHADDMVPVLVNAGASVTAVGSWGATPLHEASSDAHVIAAQSLIEHGADVNAIDVNGQTPLHWLAKRTPQDGGDTAVYATERLLLEHGAKPPIVDRYGRTASNTSVSTALYVAAELGELSRIKKLIEVHPDSVNAPAGWEVGTALHEAVRHGHREIVEFLLDHGANVNAPDYHKTTPIVWAFKPERHVLWIENIDADNGYREDESLAPESVRTRDIANILLQHGAHVETDNKSVSMALIFAIDAGDTTAMGMLLAHGVDPNRPRYDYQNDSTTLLHWLAHGWVDKGKEQFLYNAITTLVTHGARLDIKDKDGKIPADLAKDDRIKALLTVH